MMERDVRKCSIGIHFNNSGNADVVVWAPGKKKVELIITGSNNPIALEKDAFGYWRTSTAAIHSGDHYQFRIDDDLEVPDPASLSQPDGVPGSSQAINLKNFKWNEGNWKNIPLQEYIIYELHTGTFTPEGTFEGIESKLDHLIDLGITAIEIMPVAQFPGGRNWGYDGVFPFAVQNTYGGPGGLQRLINACHQKNLAVILDVVYNHLGPEGNYFKSYGPYFTEKYKTPWGEAINLDDAWCDGVRNYFIENALMWFRDFHVDALRLDAVHAIKDFSPVHFLHELRRQVDALKNATGREHYLVIECDLNDTKYINPEGDGAYGMDSQWIDEFHHALRVTATGDQTGYYSDFQGIEHLAKSYRDAYVYDGGFSTHRKKLFGVPAKNNPGQQFIVFSQNHDQIGNRMAGERTSVLVSFEMQKLMAGAVMVAPFLPMLFMGEEWSEPNPFLYFISHTDPDLVEAVRKGRKEEFAAFHSEAVPPDPFAATTFQQSTLQWQLTGEKPHSVMLEYYRALIALRKKTPALAIPDRSRSEASCDSDKSILTLHRWMNDQHVYCVMNFSKRQQPATLPDTNGSYQVVLDSSAEKWNGPGNETIADKAINGRNRAITLQPESIIIFLTDV